MAQHEAAAATRPLEALFEIIGDLGGGAGDCGGVAGRGTQAVLHELIKRNFAIVAQGLSELGDEPDRRGLGSDDALVQFAQRKARRQRRHVETGVVRQPGADGLARHAVDQTFAHALRCGLGLADHDLRRPDDADLRGIATFREQRGIYLGTLLRHRRDRLPRPENVVDEPHRRPRAARRAAGLDQDRHNLR